MTDGDPQKPSSGTIANQETIIGPAPDGSGPDDLSLSQPRLIDLGRTVADDLGFEGRYEVRTVLGAGGMGEVRLCRDGRIGREIAMKLVHRGYGSRSDLKERFLHEARVQGQLEHPSVPPVYDLGLAPDGSAFFTMKRVKGRTLEEIVRLLQDRDEDASKRYTRHKLLTAMTSLCLAVDFAHTRGAVHRDIKPANLMLGDFGEVYLLDWGLAKIVGGVDGAVEGVGGMDVPRSSGPKTAYGAVMGTPGYMPPEQVAAAATVGPTADVYALGAVLFEMLALEPLHRGSTLEELLESTMLGAEARFSVRTPERDLPPELEAICVKATAIGVGERYATARELCDAIERFLEGDRDLARRKEMAAAHADAAAQALSSTGPAEDVRRQAMRELGRALALDPGNPTAMRTMVRLLTDLPREVPREVQEELDALSRNQIRLGGRSGGFAFLSLNLYLPLLLWMGMRSWAMLLFFGLATLAALTSFAVSRFEEPRSRHAMLVLALMTLCTAAVAGILGPFVLLPGMAAATTMIFSTTNDRQLRVPIIAIGCLTLLIPIGLEMTGIIPPSLAFAPEGVVLLPRVVFLPRVPTLAFLLITCLATIITAGLALAPFRDQFDDAQRRMRVLSWHLRHLVPDEALRSDGHGEAR